MSKTHRRSRQRRGKLSRRMKKRGGTKSSLKTAQSASNGNPVRISSIVSAQPLYRAPFFERVKVSEQKFKQDFKPTEYKYEGPNIIFTIHTKAGPTKFTVNKIHDEEEQRKAFVRFDNKFRTIQNDFIRMLSSSRLELHDEQWMCVKAGNGIWHPSGKHEGSWTMLPEKFNCDINVTDEFVRSEAGKQWISAQNDKHIFCVPKNYRSIMTLHKLGDIAVISR